MTTQPFSPTPIAPAATPTIPQPGAAQPTTPQNLALLSAMGTPGIPSQSTPTTTSPMSPPQAPAQSQAPVQSSAPTPQQMSVDDFANSIKQKYPQYQSLDNQTLTQKIVAKYPQYTSQVNIPPAPVSTPKPSTGQVISQTLSGLPNTLSQGIIGNAITPAGQQWLSSPAFNMQQNQSGLLGTIAKSGVNSAKSLLNAGVGLASAFDPTATVGKLTEIPGTIGGFVKDASAAAQSQQGVNQQIQAVQEAIARDVQEGKDPSRLQGVLKTLGVADYSGGGGAALGNLAQSVIPAVTKTVLPSAVQKILPTNIAGVQVGGQGGQFTKAVQSVAEDPYQLLPAFLMLKSAMDYNTPTQPNENGELPINEKTGAPQTTTRPFGDSAIGQGIDKTISGAASPFITAAGKVADFAKPVLNLAQKVATFGTSQATGLSPKTISSIISNPDAFSQENMQQFTREGIGQDIGQKINDRLTQLGETGQEYQNIRNSDDVALIPKFEGDQVTTPIQTVLDKFGLSLDENGQVQTNAESTPMSKADIASLQDFIDTFGDKDELSANAFLNARKALSNMSSFDAAKTDAADAMSRSLRAAYDSIGKDQITGLSDLDSRYAPEVKLLRQIKTDYFKPDGTFKDNALSKLANLTNVGREQVLGRLEQIDPGAGQKIATLKAVEDIANASGQKVGAYTRSAVMGGGAIEALSHPTLAVPAIVAAILSSPDVATQILRGFGKLRGLDISGPIKSAFGQAADVYNQATTKTPPTPPTAGPINDIANQATGLTKANGGVTINLKGDIPTEGYSVATDKTTEHTIPQEEYSPETTAQYIKDNLAALQKPGNYLGMWIDNGKVYYDVPSVFTDKVQAAKAAKAADQLGIFDLKNFNTIGKDDYEKIISADEAKPRGNARSVRPTGTQDVAGQETPGRKGKIKSPPGTKVEPFSPSSGTGIGLKIKPTP